MSNLSKAFRSLLAEKTELTLPEIVNEQVSPDGTYKWSLEITPKNQVETVFIPEKTRSTLCVSSQIGCTLDCSFCATGKQGFNGNLTAAQIVGQVYQAEKRLSGHLQPSGRAITNVVFMGMGEPLLNFDNVLAATKILTDDLAFGLSKRRVTISTAGVVPAIYKLADSSDVSLAVSLHAANDTLRSQLVPINRAYPIEELLAACRAYQQQALGKRRTITFEYTMLADVNDQPEHLQELLELLKKFPAKVNLIPFNWYPGSNYKKPAMNKVRAFQEGLIAKGIHTMVRTTRGDSIAAACGQLVGEFQDKTKRRERYINLKQVIVSPNS